MLENVNKKRNYGHAEGEKFKLELKKSDDFITF